ncbi:unnamed protein product [Prunus armeniaca]|uniref:Uncharacterized protein n=1 Tax=Prunus armeniaca TaxID=36596 RepID=A0A6J5VVT1_PRUAR|nr:unnamed protein product [Prunus armeniaca]
MRANSQTSERGLGWTAQLPGNPLDSRAVQLPGNLLDSRAAQPQKGRAPPRAVPPSL